MEISNLLDKKFKVMIIKMLTKLRRRTDEHKISVVIKYEEEPNRAKEYKTETENMLEGTTNQMIQGNR